jgi:hypothetical protein
MADPAHETLVKNEWKKVATNVTSGLVHALAGPGRYFHTYRDTGGAAPSNSESNRALEGVPFEGLTEQIASAIGIDVYVYCSEAGRLRVDLI